MGLRICDFACVCAACLWCVPVVCLGIYALCLYICLIICSVLMGLYVYRVSEHLRKCLHECFCGLSFHVYLSVSVACVSGSVYAPDYVSGGYV